MKEFPAVLRSYIDGLKNHDVEKIGRLVAEDLIFVTPAQTLNKPQFLGLLRAIYAGFPDWRYEHGGPEFRKDVIAVKFRQGGNHTETFTLPGFNPIPATGRPVAIPEHYFFYKLRGEQIVEIRPEPVEGGAPGGIFEQIGVQWPPV